MKITHLLNSFLVLALLLGIAPTARTIEPLNTLSDLDNSIKSRDRSMYVFGDWASAAVQSSSQNVELVGRSIGGYPVDAVAIQGNYAYVGFGLELTVIDVSDPSNLTHVGNVSLSNIVNEIVAVGNYIYIANDDQGGLRVFDISEPGAPIEIGYVDTPGSASDLAVAGNYAYVADGKSGLRVVDISLPGPTEVGFYDPYDDSGSVHNIAVADNYAYIIGTGCGWWECNSELVVIDISNPITPTQIGSCWFYPNTIKDISVSGDYAYAIDDNNNMRVINISDPANPTLIRSYSLGRDAGSVFADGYYAYVAGKNYFEIVDVSDPANPTRASRSETSGYGADIAVTGNYAYVIGEGGLQIVDISDHAHPSEVGLYGAIEGASDLAVAGDYAYAINPSTGLHILDISDPTKPVVVSFYSIDVPGFTGITSVAIAGDYAYVGTDFDDLWVLDVSDPVHPTQIGQIDSPSPLDEALDVVVIEDYAYIATSFGNGFGGLVVVDVSDPANPVQVSTCEIPDYSDPEKVIVAEDYAYLASRYADLRIIDISDPTNPTEVGHYDPLASSYSVDVAGNYAYFANAYCSLTDCSSYLRIVDVADPTSPTEIGFYDLAADYYNSDFSVTVPPRGNFAYVGDSHSVRVVDVSDPTDPVEIGFHDNTPGMDIVVARGYIYVAADGLGLVILRFVGTISGKVSDHNATPFSNVTISAGSGISATTDADGYYIIGDLDAGTYTLTPTLSGYAFWPPTRTITVSPDASGQNFTILPAPISTTLTLGITTTLTYTDTQDLPTHLTFPADTITQTTTIVLTPTLASDSPGLAFAGHAFDLAAYQADTVQLGLTFNVPVTATIRYSDEDIAVVTDENELVLRWWDGITWVDAATTCEMTSLIYNRDGDDNVLSVPICRLGRYALLGPTHQVFLSFVTRRSR